MSWYNQLIIVLIDVTIECIELYNVLHVIVLYYSGLGSHLFCVEALLIINV